MPLIPEVSISLVHHPVIRLEIENLMAELWRETLKLLLIKWVGVTRRTRTSTHTDQVTGEFFASYQLGQQTLCIK